MYQTEFNMKLRTVTKLGVILSVILFGIGIGLYSFAKLSINDQKNDVDFLSFIPENCIGVFETDNADPFWSVTFPSAWIGSPFVPLF